MSTLTSASTLDEVKAEYFDNASYEEDASVAKAKAFVTACRFLMLHLPKSAGKSGATFALSVTEIKEQMQHAQHWAVANATTGGAQSAVRHTDFRNFR